MEANGRRNYENDYLRFITYALASNDETIDHLETLFETESLNDENLYNTLHSKLENLGKKINRFFNQFKMNI